MKIVWNQPLTEIKTGKTHEQIKYDVKKKNKSTAESVKHKEKQPVELFPEVVDTYFPEIWELFPEE